MVTEARAMAGPTETALPIIVSSNRSLDIVPYCRYLFSHEFDRFVAILPSEFPAQADRATEEVFLRRFFSDEDIQVQGGAEGEGNGFRFLKAAWLWAADWNLNHRIPALTEWWISENQNILSDPDMKKRIFEPNVQPSTFFESKDIAMYGKKLLRLVITRIQHELRHQAPLPAAPGSPLIVDGSGSANRPVPATEPTATTTSQRNATSDPSPNTDGVAGTQQEIESKVPSNTNRQATTSQGKGKRPMYQQPETGIPGGSSSRGGHSARGSYGPASHDSNGNHVGQAGGGFVYGRQDVRYQAPLVSSQTDESQVEMMPGRAVSTGTRLPDQLEYAPPANPNTPFVGYALPAQSMTGMPGPYGCPVQANFPNQFQQHMSHPRVPPGFTAHYAQPFGDRSNFPNDGRALGDESRLFNPDEKHKQTKQGPNGGNSRGRKDRGQPYHQRGGNRGYNGGTYARGGRSFDRPSGSDFHFPAGAGSTVNDQRFSTPSRDKHWQPPFPTDGNTFAAQHYGQMPYMLNGTVPSAPPGIGPVWPHNNSHVTSPHYIQHPSTSDSGHHQRTLSISKPCAPEDCNKYTIGVNCNFAKKLMIFQVPIDLTAEAFQAHFEKFGPVEAVQLRDSRDGYQRVSWVAFANADSARQVLTTRGKPWPGGPVLFAEVAGEYWNPAHYKYSAYAADRPARGRQPASTVATTSQAPNTAVDTPGKDITSGDADKVVDPHKKRTSGNNKKPKKPGKRPAQGDGNAVGDSKGNTTRQNYHEKHAPSSDDVSKIPSGSATSTTCKPAREEIPTTTVDAMTASDTTSHEAPQNEELKGGGEDDEAVKLDGVEQTSNLESVSSVEPVAPSAVVDEDPLFSRANEQGEKAAAVVGVAILDAGPTETSINTSDEQVDESFHTADGLQGEEKVGDGPEIVAATSDGGLAASKLDVSPELPIAAAVNITEGTETTEVVRTVEPSSIDAALQVSPSATVPDTRVESASTPESPKLTEPAAPEEPYIIAEDITPTRPERSVTITVPSIDTCVAAVSEEKPRDDAVFTGQVRSISATSALEAPGTAFVTAPSTPAIAEPVTQIKSKKPLKSKGPAQTESLSLFAKPKSRKSSSKKTKHGVHGVESPGRPTSGNAAHSNNQASPTSMPSIAEAVPSVVAQDNAEPVASLNAAADHDSNASSNSSHETTSSKTWTLTDLVDPVRAFLSMGSAQQNMKSDDARPPGSPMERDDDIVQSVEPDGEDSMSKESQDLQKGPHAAPSAGLGISDVTLTERSLSPGADQGKSKKKKAKSKSKNKKLKATADVTISGNTMIDAKPSEPIHEFKGNDVASDSSSQTLGRASPASKGPSMKQVNEAKQHKPLLEPRPARQIRSKKHKSVHSREDSNNTDGTDSAEEIVVPTPHSTVFLVPCGDGRFIPVQAGLEGNGMTGGGQLALMPTATPEPSKSTPAPEKPWEVEITDEVADPETSSPDVTKSREKILQLTLEEAQKKRFA